MDIKGFRFSTVEAAIKKPCRKDIAVIFSEVPAAASAVFTTNAVKAAPVTISSERIKRGLAQAVLVNSGNANACTGEPGLAAARESSRIVSEGLGIPEELLQISSTGVIGVQMPMDRVKAAIPGLVAGLGDSSLEDVAHAIMTTDTYPKIEVRHGDAGGMPYTVAGIAKGAGMIMPNMATMLAYVITDANIEPTCLNRIFKKGVERSFNAITVDGDMSTNDTCLVMANGMAGNSRITYGSPEADSFALLLEDLLLSLAKSIVKDGEGATKFVELRVKGACTDADAKKVAFAIANSCLVKTAFYGRDANWGRIFAVAGYAGATIDQARLSLWFDQVLMAEKGVFAGPGAEEAGTEVLQKKEFTVTLDMGLGEGSATVYTCDLSHDYVSINADYRT